MGMKLRQVAVFAAASLLMWAGCSPKDAAASMDALDFVVRDISADQFHADFTVEVSRKDHRLFSGDISFTRLAVETQGDVEGTVDYLGNGNCDTLILSGRAESFSSLRGKRLTIVVEDIHTSQGIFRGRWRRELVLNPEEDARRLFSSVSRTAPSSGTARLSLEEVYLCPNTVAFKILCPPGECYRVQREHVIALYMTDGSLLPCYGGSTEAWGGAESCTCRGIRRLRHPAAVDQVCGIVVDGVEFPLSMDPAAVG